MKKVCNSSQQWQESNESANPCTPLVLGVQEPPLTSPLAWQRERKLRDTGH